MPNTKNFAYSTVLTAPSPASSGTSLVVQSGDGAKFPSVSFVATVWPAGVQPVTSNAELVTVTAISTDTFTITRQAESTSARSIIVGDQIAATISAGILPTGTILGTTDTQVATNKILADTFEGNSFQSLSATTQSYILTSSTDFMYYNALEVGSGQTLEVPSTSTLEIGGVVRTADLPVGAVVQIASTSTSAVATGTTTIPQDDTIPQNTEGTEFMSLTITPTNANNTLIIDMVALLGCDTAGRNIIGAIFQDNTANALAANIEYNDVTSAIIPTIIHTRHTMVAGTTVATTFKGRYGGHSACTVTFNGNNAARLFGAITKSSIVITEYKS